MKALQNVFDTAPETVGFLVVFFLVAEPAHFHSLQGVLLVV